MPPKQKMIEAQRPECPECGMKMIAIKPLVMARQTFECLRCGHIQKATHHRVRIDNRIHWATC